ncbi:MAG TPA: DUF5318 family protein [Actinomycetes bacterium]|jgi:hypothetical protein|nr:DUF5318 family protein [Actinomycetes bacterium]
MAGRTSAGVWSQRAVIDYALQRRATLVALRRGQAFASDLCDADPYLLRAAEHHGVPAGRTCPFCRHDDLVDLHYVYGDELGPFQGRIRAPRELEIMAREHGEFRVYVVEVCRRCSWNYLTSTFVLGDGTPRPPLRAQRGDPVL